MVFNIVGGHSAKAPGANGYYNEVTEDRKIKNAVIALLKANGQTVYDCTSDASTANAVLAEQISKCDEHEGVDVHIHLNSYNGSAKGTEVFVCSTTSKSNPYAKRVCNNLASLGFKNRGVKVSRLYVLRNSKNPALLIEVFFCDNRNDSDIYATVGVDKVAREIVKGLLNKELVVSPSAPKKSNSEIAQEVKDGKWGNMPERKTRLEAAGYDYETIRAIVNGGSASKPTVQYYPKCSSSKGSIVDGLASIGVDSSFANRKKIATANGISNYTGTSSQNTKMLSLLKAGKLKK